MIEMSISISVTERVVADRLESRGRHDDKAAIVIERLRQFESQTRPLIDRYQASGLLEEIDGSGTIEEVASLISRRLAGLVVPIPTFPVSL